MPASRSGWRRPACSAMAPPCEKPASTTRPGSMPRVRSRWIRASIACCDSRMPRSSGRRAMSLMAMSYHARICMPPLSVTGRTGACGKMKRSCSSSGSGSSRTIGTKSQPSAPRPCIQMTVPAGSGPVASSIWVSGGKSAPFLSVSQGRGSDGGFGAEGLDDFLAGFEVRAANQVDAVGHRREDAGHHGLALGRLQALERLADRLRLPRQVEDERRLADPRDLAREDRGRHELEADAPHLLTEARHLAVADRERRLGCHVARGGAGAARGHDQVARALVDEFLQRRLDPGPLVGDEAPHELDRVQERARQPKLQRRDALVLVDALRGAVARGDESDPDRVVAHRESGSDPGLTQVRPGSDPGFAAFWTAVLTAWKSSRTCLGARCAARSARDASRRVRTRWLSAWGNSRSKRAIAAGSARSSSRHFSATWKSAVCFLDGDSSAARWSAIGPASTSRMIFPMYCIWRRRASCLVMLWQAITASRRISGMSMRASCSRDSFTRAAPTSCSWRISFLRRVLLINSSSLSIASFSHA